MQVIFSVFQSFNSLLTSPIVSDTARSDLALAQASDLPELLHQATAVMVALSQENPIVIKGSAVSVVVMGQYIHVYFNVLLLTIL